MSRSVALGTRVKEVAFELGITRRSIALFHKYMAMGPNNARHIYETPCAVFQIPLSIGGKSIPGRRRREISLHRSQVQADFAWDRCLAVMPAGC